MFIAARIASIFVSSAAVHIYDFHVFTAIIQALDCQTNSSFHHLRKCTENNMENLHTEFRVQRENVFLILS